MIARHDGRVVLVGGAIPGERVMARVRRVAKGVAYAETLSIDEPSPDRRVRSRDPLCGGCLYSHIAYPRQLAIKSLVIADAFTRIGHLELPGPVCVAGSPEEGYRMRARLHVRGSRCGFFREATHELCDVRLTGQLLPATMDALDRLMAAIRSIGADAVREIELSENVDASERVAHLQTSAPIDPRLMAKLTVGRGTDSGPLRDRHDDHRRRHAPTAPTRARLLSGQPLPAARSRDPCHRPRADGRTAAGSLCRRRAVLGGRGGPTRRDHGCCRR